MDNYKCKCGNTYDFFHEHNLSQCGLYCGCCGKWIKWLNKDEERLFKHKHSNADGYICGVRDFYTLISTTNNTPKEIYERLTKSR